MKITYSHILGTFINKSLKIQYLFFPMPILNLIVSISFILLIVRCYENKIQKIITISLLIWMFEFLSEAVVAMIIGIGNVTIAEENYNFDATNAASARWSLIPFKSKRILIYGGKNYMRSKFFLIAIVIFLVCLLLEQLKRTKKEGLDKLSIGGLSVAIIGVVIVLISSIFV